MEGEIERLLDMLREMVLCCRVRWKVGERSVESVAEERNCQSSLVIRGARRR